MRCFIVLSSCWLVACSGMPETNYYILSSVPETTLSPESRGDNVLGVGRIVLADYLRQSGVIMQTDNNQIRAAHYHRWGEPLQRGVRRSLAQQLSVTLPEYRIESAQRDERRLSYRLDVEIERFHATEDGRAVLSGRWTLYRIDDRSILASKRFNLSDTIADSGYPTAVSAQSGLLSALGRGIATSTLSAVAMGESRSTSATAMEAGRP